MHRVTSLFSSPFIIFTVSGLYTEELIRYKCCVYEVREKRGMMGKEGGDEMLGGNDSSRGGESRRVGCMEEDEKCGV